MKCCYYYCLLILLLLLGIRLGAQQRVKLHAAVPINGIDQWIGATGNDASQPVLLFLHGGPGFSSRPYAKQFIRHLKDDFIVVQWDQRETGITKSWSPYPDSLTLDLLYADTEAVVDYLRGRFHREKIYLVGYSWGNVLGTELARTHPEWLHAYVNVSGLIDGHESDRRTLLWLEEQARLEDNPVALDALAETEVPVTDWQDIYQLRKWAAHYSEGRGAAAKYPEKLFQEWAARWLPVYLQAADLNQRNRARELDCPTYLFVGRKDYVAHHTLAAEYYALLSAPQKRLVWFDRGHDLPGDAKAFARELLRVRDVFNR